MSEPARPFRLCVDLNIWMARYLSRLAAQYDTAARVIANAARDGRSALGPVQLIISHVMLTRLTDALVRKGAPEVAAQRYTRLIASFASLGPSREAAHIVLGGGVEPTRDAVMPRYDPYDPSLVPTGIDREDGRVLDTALAARADALVTGNIRDFQHHQDTVIADGRILVQQTATHQLIIIRTQEMAAWLRTGVAPDGVPPLK